jgi:hypothetical protein
VFDRDEGGASVISNDESPLPDTEVHYLRSEQREVLPREYHETAFL